MDAIERASLELDGMRVEADMCMLEREALERMNALVEDGTDADYAAWLVSNEYPIAWERMRELYARQP